MSERDQRVAALEAITAPSQFICNMTSKVWHQTREHRAGHVCYTSCGWTYTGLQFEVAHALPASVPHKLICGTCLPKLHHEAKSIAARPVTPKLD